MDVNTAYVSSIPTEALEKIKAKKRAEYFLNGERVGERSFHPSGDLEYEYAFSKGVKHGWQYRWDEPGKLLSAEPYENGLPHGTAYQWASDGRLIGSYTFYHGTGIDLWWHDWPDGTIELAEVRYLYNGLRNGFEWWFCEGRRLSSEQHWQKGIMHGIERRWNFQGGLHRGFPRYWVQGERVVKVKYLKFCVVDATLPVFDAEDNLPYRAFPAEIEKPLRQE